MHLRSIFLGTLVACAVTSCITSMPPNSHSAPATASAAASNVEPFVWPNGARAAVSLTYDDAIQSQLDNAAPALARHGLIATFFLTGHSQVLKNSAERYRALVQAGNELGSHTMDHPCDRSLSFVKPGFALQDYDLARMQADLLENIAQLRDLGQKKPFSFAYPCGSTWLGEQHTSYVPLIQQLFVAARGVNGRVSDPSQDPLSEVPSPMGNESGADLTSWVDRALAQGGWVVFTFHGVAGDYLAVQADAHEALLSYLEKHKSSVWTERFGTVASYVKAQRKP
jgi:peptidoglycan/xylan/chitin deacetylase (PgdA/CDA1 family)